MHHLIAEWGAHDAVSTHALRARDLMRGWGLRSDVHAARPGRAGARRGVRPARALLDAPRDDALVVLHLSSECPAYAAAAAGRHRLAMHYHNITPAPLVARHAPAVALRCAAGRRQLAALAGRVEAAWADSAYNCAELADLGYPDPRPVGILPPAGTERPPPGDRPPAAGRPLRLLFVGRGMPHKGQRDLVLALAALAEAGVDAELTLAGGWADAPGYLEECRDLAARCDVAGRLRITGPLADDALARAYAAADAFACLSRHEGFCVPLLEAMWADLPIVALAAAAVPETVGAAGILLPAPTPSLVAEAVIATGDPALRASMAAGRAERRRALSSHAVAERMRAALDAAAG